MTFGPKLCACCGSKDGIEAHHLYSRRSGCPDDLTVWLCFDCHGRAHEMSGRIKIGNPRLRAGNRETGLVAGTARRQQANARAADVMPHIMAARKAGRTTLIQIAAALNARGVRTARGGPWHPTT